MRFSHNEAMDKRYKENGNKRGDRERFKLRADAPTTTIVLHDRAAILITRLSEPCPVKYHQQQEINEWTSWLVF